MADIELRNIRKTFKDVVAVRDINLHIQDGEFVAFLGPSGCGKTTTLRIVSGLEVPDSGRVLIGGQDVTDLPPRSRDIAMVFQDYALYPHMTVLDNIGYPLKVRGIAKPEIVDEVRSVATNLQIEMLLERRPAQLSGGQQQRVAVARAVVHQAKAFLFDEPLSNLDAKLRLEARAFLKHLQHAVGITSIYVTHDQAEAMALADRIVIMQAGDVMQVGTPQDIYREPVNIFVASFIGNPPMNLLPCHLHDGHIQIQGDGEFVSVAVPAAHLPRQMQREDRVTLGIRPEHITILTEPAPNTIPARLYVTQNLGSEVLVIAYIGEQLVSIRIFTDEVPDLPDQIYLQFDLDRLFFYDANEALMP